MSNNSIPSSSRYLIPITVKKILLFLQILTFCQVGYNQIIKGTILDQSNNSKIAFATVYINGTSVGTYTDQNGYFKLDITKFNSMSLTISALGYFSVTLSSFSKDKLIVVNLKPKIFQLKEVVINSKLIDKERTADLRIFRNEFLGTTDNARSCQIINEKDITFNTGNSDDTLKAYASMPITIYNNALGYRIIYYLDKFEYYKKSKAFFYSGNCIINEDSTSSKTQKQLIERRRKYAYLGSRMHFFRSLWEDDLESTGFVIGNSLYKNLYFVDLVSVDDSLKKSLAYKEDLRIAYYSRVFTSFIHFVKGSVFFDKTGYFDATGIIWDGQMGRQRIGDLLPYEYEIN